jgi:curved DNA-binding protein CbpA
VASDEDILLLCERLPGLSYYQILSLPHRYATPPEVKRAFHEFAQRVHPDEFVGAPLEVREAAREAFKRAVESYEVLRDASLQRRYVETYLKNGKLRLPPAEFSRRSIPPPPAPVAAPRRASSPPASMGQQPRPRLQSQPLRPRTWIDDVQTADGREVAERVERMVTEGRWKDAFQHVSLLESLEPDNLAVKTKRNAIKRRLDRGMLPGGNTPGPSLPGTPGRPW